MGLRGTQVTLLAMLLVASVPAAARAAVSDYLGKPIVSVLLVIEGRETTEAGLVQLVETRAGRPLSMAAVRESLTHLFSLGRFEDIRVDAFFVDGGVSLVYELVPVHPVTRLAFAGALDAPGVDVGQLRRAVVDRYGPSPPLGRAADLTRTIADALRERGYRNADVTPRAELAHAPDRATLVFTIGLGPRTRVGTIDIAGAPNVSPAELLRQLRIAPGAPYEEDALRTRIERYVESWRSRGYYEAQIVPAVQFADGDRLAHLTLAVTPGAHGRVVFTGDPLPSDKRAELVPIEREGSVDEDLLEDSSNRIEEYLLAQGYRDATARYTRQQTNGELVITFTVRNGPQYHVARVDISGNASVPLLDFQSGLRLRTGETFSAAALEADVAAIEDVYHRRGFASAKAQVALEIATAAATLSQALVVVRIVIQEGVRTVVGAVRILGNASVPEVVLARNLALQPGRPYFDAQLRADGDAIQVAYANLGYLNATVEATPNFTPDRTQVNPVFTVREGLQLFVEHVLIVGNVRTSAETIERELQLRPGDPLSRAAEIESQRRLAALGLFRRIRFVELRRGQETRRDLLVSVEEGPATTVGYGGGFDVRQRVVRRAEDAGVAAEKLEFAPRASFEIGRRNLFGKNRSANVFTSVSLHPKDSPFFAGQSTTTSDGGYGLTEYRVLGTFREPRLFNTTADAFITGTLEQQIRSSFNFARRSANADLARKVTRTASVSGSYQIQRTRVFDESVDPADKRLVDRLFPQVRLSSFSSSAIRDTRDDVVDPAHGSYVSISGQLAARRIGSEVGFMKTLTSGQFFHPVAPANRLVVAGGARLGLADVFPREVVATDSQGRPTVQVVEDLPASERFFAGGDTTVRGYALDTLATSQTKDKDGFPIGGSALVIFNLEVRASVWNPVQVVGFFDAGNVFAHAGQIDVGELKSAIGFGVRYRSPVGPIRVDLGFKLRRDQIAPGVREGLTALHISLGQAF